MDLYSRDKNNSCPRNEASVMISRTMGTDPGHLRVKANREAISSQSPKTGQSFGRDGKSGRDNNGATFVPSVVLPVINNAKLS
jgi:hypothetical protein